MESFRSIILSDNFKDIVEAALLFYSPINRRQGDSEVKGVRELYIGNIPINASNTELHSYFEQFGRIAHVRLKEHKQRGLFETPPKTKFGFVTFKDEEGVRNALNSSIPFKGHNLRMNISNKSREKSLKILREPVSQAVNFSKLAGGAWISPTISLSSKVETKQLQLIKEYTVTNGQIFLNQNSIIWKFRATIETNDSPYFNELVPIKAVSHFSNIKNVFYSDLNNGNVQLTVTVNQPPKLWILLEGDVDDRRTTDWTSGELKTPMGRASVFVFTCNRERAVQMIDNCISSGVAQTLQGPQLVSVTCPVSNFPEELTLPFKVRYMIESLINYNVVPEGEVSYLIEELERHKFEVNESKLSQDAYDSVLEFALQWLLCPPLQLESHREAEGRYKDSDYLVTTNQRLTKQSLRDELEKAVKGCLENFERKLYPPNLPSYCILARKILITPTKQYLLPPQAIMSNNVLREAQSRGLNLENFIRLAFVDEDFNLLTSDTITPCISQRMKRTFDQGIVVGGKRFKFLACSTSQLRQQSGWWYSPSKEVSVQSVRSWIGDFSAIKNIAKCTARMGQAFSSTYGTVKLLPDEIRVIPDIERYGYNFSDGNGLISAETAAEIASILGIPVPSAFQIRYGGAKGMLTIDPTLHDHKVLFRNSMMKFPSPAQELGVIRVSSATPCYLNRQEIIVLSTLGIEDRHFMELLSPMLKDIAEMFSDPKTAEKMLKESGGGGGQDGSSWSDQIKTYVSMTRADLIKDRHLQYILTAIASRRRRDLKRRARIFVPDGKFLLGVVDTTATLNYGEIFVQLSDSKGGKVVIQGKTVVGKCPCLHPGDLRVLEAVNNSQLQHLVDVVVFPQKGFRPHSNECSGSDLDGDVYSVIWDKNLIPLRNETPMELPDPTPPKNVSLGHPSDKEIQSWFVEHGREDTVGIIATAHLVWADQSPEKCRDPKCLELARLHSVAVDYPKTGVPAKIPSHLRLKSYPAFLEKKDKERHASGSVLGLIFREVGLSTTKDYQKLDDEKNLKYDRNLIYGDFKHFIDDANFFAYEYTRDIIIQMRKFGIKREAQFVTGLIPSRGLPTKSQRDIEKSVKLQMSFVRNKYLSAFLEHPASPGEYQRLVQKIRDYLETKSSINSELEYFIAKASSWYHVTYDPQKKYPRPFLKAKKPMLSFPWIVGEILCEIKHWNSKSEISTTGVGN